MTGDLADRQIAEQPVREDRPATWRSTLDTIASVLVILAAGGLLWNTFIRPSGRARAERKAPAELQSIQEAATLGNRNAPLGVIEYSDFQCPYCGRFARDVLPTLVDRYVKTGQVLFLFRHFPLERIHGQAFRAAEGAECAARQGRFWEAHDELFRNQRQLDPANLLAIATRVGVDQAAWQQCISGGDSRQVRNDMATAKKLGIVGTPFFLVGRIQPGGLKVGHMIEGFKPVDEFEALLDQMIRDTAR